MYNVTVDKSLTMWNHCKVLPKPKHVEGHCRLYVTKDVQNWSALKKDFM